MKDLYYALMAGGCIIAGLYLIVGTYTIAKHFLELFFEWYFKRK